MTDHEFRRWQIWAVLRCGQCGHVWDQLGDTLDGYQVCGQCLHGAPIADLDKARKVAPRV